MRHCKSFAWLVIASTALVSGCWRNQCCQPCNPCYGARTIAPAFSSGYATNGCSPVYGATYATDACGQIITTAQTPIAPIPQSTTTTTSSSSSPTAQTIAQGKKTL
jgi:hypothetical protein